MNTSQFFANTPIFAMLHLAGEDPVTRALDELTLFEEEGIDGVIVENYHGSVDDVISTLGAIQERRTTLQVGVNILPNNYLQAFTLANKYGGSFIQQDYVAGRYASEPRIMYPSEHGVTRALYSQTIVLGGVWPKYYTPIPGSDLETDLQEGMKRADAIVVTGEATGRETPLEKIRGFRRVLGDYPLVIGAGLTPHNAREQLLIADGAIVGSCFKLNYKTGNPVDRAKVRVFMDVVRSVREEKKRL
ncbi:membrane biogenesis protein [Candidatus Woesearchaeota archaeon]|nr:membrane biogenesis protein [Candidatus Woesearchaeota archaeon]